MPILTVLLVIIVAGFLVYVVERFVPMDATFKWILKGLIVILTIVWLLRIFGVWGAMSNIKV